MIIGNPNISTVVTRRPNHPTPNHHAHGLQLIPLPHLGFWHPTEDGYLPGSHLTASTRTFHISISTLTKALSGAEISSSVDFTMVEPHLYRRTSRSLNRWSSGLRGSLSAMTPLLTAVGRLISLATRHFKTHLQGMMIKCCTNLPSSHRCRRTFALQQPRVLVPLHRA